MSMTLIIAIVVIALLVVAGIVTLVFLRKRRTERLRSKFGGAEYARAVKEGGSRRHGGSRARQAHGTSRELPRPAARGRRS